MMCKKISPQAVSEFAEYLREEEKSRATVEKYMRDVRRFLGFANGKEVTKGLTMEYKAKLLENYTAVSANSMIASLNSFLRFMDLGSCCVKQFKIQQKIYCPEEKELTREEYFRLVSAAKAIGCERFGLLIETICATGIRVSELRYITVEAVRHGEATVSCKGKTRTVFISNQLRKKLLRYIKEQKILSGVVFVTRTGKPINRCNIWRKMKALCEKAGVAPAKVFPHNLRHLFARTFYGIDKDIVKLADILGHSSINTTRIYIVTTGEEHRRKIDGMRLIS